MLKYPKNILETIIDDRCITDVGIDSMKTDVIALGWMADVMPMWQMEEPLYYIMCYMNFCYFMSGR